MTNGRRARSRPTIAESRRHFEEDLALLPEPACRIDAPQAPAVRLTERLRQITAETKRGLAARVRR
jgi:nicotinate phosphoribosyltransferase